MNLACVANDQGRRHGPENDRANGLRAICGSLLPPRAALATPFDRLAH
jgi:hypothetical protein